MKKRPTMMADALMAAGSAHAENAYEVLLRDESKYGQHEFLLQAVKRGYLRPAERAVITDLIKGKIKPPKHRPPKVQTRLKEVTRALRVLDLEQLDLERDGRSKRESALAQATAELHCQRRSLQKALAEHEEWLRGAAPELLQSIRAVK